MPDSPPQEAIAAAAIAIGAGVLYLGRRDLTRPAVAFGVVWFGCVALAQLQLTQLETDWSTGFTLLVFSGGLVFVTAAVAAGGTAPVRGRLAVSREGYQPRRLVAAALLLLVAAAAGTAYKAHVQGGIPLLSGEADVIRNRAFQDGSVAVPTWSTALTDCYFLAMWTALLALWVVRGRASRTARAALLAVVAVGLLGVALPASRNALLLPIVVPLVAVYVLTRPRTRLGRVRWIGVTLGVVALVVGGLFVARIAQTGAGQETFLDRELARQPAAVDPLIPFYINGVYPFEAANRLYGEVPTHHPYGAGANSLTSFPDAAYPEGKPAFGAELAELMGVHQGTGLSWSVGTYQARLYGDAGWPGVLLGSALLGLGFGALYRWARGRAGLAAVVLVGYLAYYSAFMAYDNLLSFSLIAVFDLVAVALLDSYVRGGLVPPLSSLARGARRAGTAG